MRVGNCTGILKGHCVTNFRYHQLIVKPTHGLLIHYEYFYLPTSLTQRAKSAVAFASSSEEIAAKPSISAGLAGGDL